MPKSKAAVVAASMVTIAVVLLGIFLGFFLFQGQSEERSPSESAQETAMTHNLGITYLTVTPTLAAYYELGVESGALVTEVGPNSIADKAGVKVGDVILSFNGARLGEGAPLLGLMRACHPQNTIVMEVLRRKSITSVELVHTAR